MGMAASQARYLALVARKSNCEFEGQQINQARTVLSNQSANLFNQMLTLSVPVPPSVQDFTKIQYSFVDGVNASTIDKWEQLSTADPNYNYVVTHHYYTDQYTGCQKMLNDPQVQIKGTVATPAELANARLAVQTAEKALENQMNAVETAKNNYDQELENLNSLKANAARLENYATEITATQITVDANGIYTITTADRTTTFKPYENLTGTEEDATSEKGKAFATINTLANDAHAISDNYVENKDGLYFDSNGNFVYEQDLERLLAKYSSNPTDFSAKLNSYNASRYTDTYQSQIALSQTLLNNTLSPAYENAKGLLKGCEKDLADAIEAYEALNHPTYVGNCELTALASLTDDQKAELRQIVADMEKDDITSEIRNCFDEDGNYLGGVYSFEMNGKTYFTTYNDLTNSYASGNGINNIDDQQKMAYYYATTVSTRVEKTEKALLETDGNGRFTSVRFEDNSLTYALEMETISDDVAYKDAMNQYYYENAIYDKTIQDINAKTSIIQQQDQQLELRLKQLDTEQKALSTEMEAVKKVVNDNVESSFKTFNG